MYNTFFVSSIAVFYCFSYSSTTNNNIDKSIFPLPLFLLSFFALLYLCIYLHIQQQQYIRYLFLYFHLEGNLDILFNNLSCRGILKCLNLLPGIIHIFKILPCKYMHSLKFSISPSVLCCLYLSVPTNIQKTLYFCQISFSLKKFCSHSFFDFMAFHQHQHRMCQVYLEFPPLINNIYSYIYICITCKQCFHSRFLYLLNCIVCITIAQFQNVSIKYFIELTSSQEVFSISIKVA